MTERSSSGDFEAEFDRALALRDQGRHEEALALLSRLEESGEHLRAVVGATAGILYYEVKNVERAMPYLIRSVALSPHSERASLALFHALFETGKEDEAFQEMRRYLAHNDSEEYRRLLADLNRE